MIYLEKESDFDSITSKGVVLVDFFATWCGPCQLINTELEKLEKEVSNLTILKVDVDKFGLLAIKFNVNSIPDIKVIKDGKIIKSAIGYKTSEELKQLLEK